MGLSSNESVFIGFVEISMATSRVGLDFCHILLRMEVGERRARKSNVNFNFCCAVHFMLNLCFGWEKEKKIKVNLIFLWKVALAYIWIYQSALELKSGNAKIIKHFHLEAGFQFS